MSAGELARRKGSGGRRPAQMPVDGASGCPGPVTGFRRPDARYMRHGRTVRAGTRDTWRRQAGASLRARRPREGLPGLRSTTSGGAGCRRSAGTATPSLSPGAWWRSPARFPPTVTAARPARAIRWGGLVSFGRWLRVGSASRFRAVGAPGRSARVGLASCRRAGRGVLAGGIAVVST